MSVASRIEAIETHIGDIYDSLELGGADLTNVNKNIVNINTQLIDRYKYYLANGIDVIWTNWEKVLGEGTDLTLNNTIKARLQLDLKGNTSQNGEPTPSSPQDIHVVSGDNTIKVDGKNLLPNTATTDTINQLAFTINDDKSISISGTPNATTTFSINTTNITLPAGTYTMSTHKEGTFSGNAYINVRLADESANITTINLRLSSSATFTLEQETTLYVRIYSSSGITFTGVKIYPMIEKGETASTYTPYQTPQTQLISLGVENLFDKSTITTINNGTITNDIITSNPISSNYGGVSANISGLTLQKGTYYVRVKLKRDSGTSGDKLTRITLVGIDTSLITMIDNPDITNDYQIYTCKITPTETITITNIGIQLQPTNTDAVISYTDIMISKPMSEYYYPYGTTPLWLGKISTYQDYFYKSSGKWYLHKEIGKRVFDGSEEDWEIYNNTITTKTIVRITNIDDIENYNESDYGNAPILISTYFKSTSQASTWNIGTMSRRFQDQNIVYFTISPPYETLANFKTWLSTHNTEVYYILATPTNTEITDTILKQQLENIYNLMSYNTQTNISQLNNDEPFIISATALKELE